MVKMRNGDAILFRHANMQFNSIHARLFATPIACVFGVIKTTFGLTCRLDLLCVADAAASWIKVTQGAENYTITIVWV